jgi:hypothetical protein
MGRNFGSKHAAKIAVLAKMDTGRNAHACSEITGPAAKSAKVLIISHTPGTIVWDVERTTEFMSTGNTRIPERI